MSKRGGKVLASGGFGCVFSPALKCKNYSKRMKHNVSKLMKKNYAIEEYNEILNVKKQLENIHNYKRFFLLNDINLCAPDKLTRSDLTSFTKKCKIFARANITKKNINKNVDKLYLLNMPNGGLPVDDYMYANINYFKKIVNLNKKLKELLTKGILEMNKRFIFHGDIKDSNVLVQDNTGTTLTRLIDWGLTIKYVPYQHNPIPKTWINRPLQFNVPFSVIIFTDLFVEEYEEFMKTHPEEEQLKTFIIKYITLWTKERGPGHLSFITEILLILFKEQYQNVKPKKHPEVTLNYVANYIFNVLKKFNHKNSVKVNLSKYLDNVFIKNADIYGFICVYLPLLELLHNNFVNLNENQLKMLDILKNMFIDYLFEPITETINVKELLDNLDKLDDYLKENMNIASGIKKFNKMSKFRKHKKFVTATNLSYHFTKSKKLRIKNNM